jgi:choline kinase
MKNIKCIILAGGEATRLGSICKDFPKTLLEVGSEPILLSQIKRLRQDLTSEIIISTNNNKNKLLIELMLKKKGIRDIEVLANKLHNKGSLWGLLGAIEHFEEVDIIFCFSDIYFPSIEFAEPSLKEEPWVSGYWSESKEEILGGGVVETEKDNMMAKKLYYKNVPGGLNRALIWSGLTHLKDNEVQLLRSFLEINENDVPEEDFINYCINNGSEFKTIETGVFMNINSPADLTKARSVYDSNSI